MLDINDFDTGGHNIGDTYVIYAPAGQGKTTLASQFPNPVLFDLNDGANRIPFKKFPVGKFMVDDPRRTLFKNYNELLASVGEIASGKYPFSTLVIDSCSEIEKFIQKKCASDYGMASFDKIGYGKGPVAVIPILNELLDGLSYLKNSLGMDVVLLAHAELKKFPNASGDDYQRWVIQGEKQFSARLEQWPDNMFFINEEIMTRSEGEGVFKKVKAVRGNPRFLYTAGTSHFSAKSRPTKTGVILPPKIQIEAHNGYLNLMEASGYIIDEPQSVQA